MTDSNKVLAEYLTKDYVENHGLTDFDILQIEQAANGCVSGVSDEWPYLVKAIEKITKTKLTRKDAGWLRGFCVCYMALRGEN